ncbi:MAG: hypothetical protein PHI64_07970 [Zoogloea sp.]|uniref:hypothetical protein n=1 Tax=Zoogloea sp. TaxID=49181 RepID=UPI0026173981|nr:hypothetical protein [Zoogloea sp.]MDD2988882.1 hypothetical protein [Zoogloea sp.]
MMSPKLTGRLPEAVRRALIEASQVGAPDSMERRCAIDNAILNARLRHPVFFKVEVFIDG